MSTSASPGAWYEGAAALRIHHLHRRRGLHPGCALPCASLRVSLSAHGPVYSPARPARRMAAAAEWQSMRARPVLRLGAARKGECRWKRRHRRSRRSRNRRNRRRRRSRRNPRPAARAGACGSARWAPWRAGRWATPCIGEFRQRNRRCAPEKSPRASAATKSPWRNWIATSSSSSSSARPAATPMPSPNCGCASSTT